MCDSVRQENVPTEEIPKYVFKLVQKVGNGKYVTPVMGETLFKGSWKKAPKIKQPREEDVHGALIHLIETKYPYGRYSCSSSWASQHVAKWGSFKAFKAARNCCLAHNYVDQNGKKFEPIIVKCEIKGSVDKAFFMSSETYLSTHIRVVEEICSFDRLNWLV